MTIKYIHVVDDENYSSYDPGDNIIIEVTDNDGDVTTATFVLKDLDKSAIQ